MRSLGVRTGVLLGVVLAIAASCACQTVPRREIARPRVLVVGDSLVVESQDAIRTQLPEVRVVARTGAAPCSLIDEVVRAARSADVVVLAFSGNNSFLAPCMTGCGSPDRWRLPGQLRGLLGTYRCVEAAYGAHPGVGRRTRSEQRHGTQCRRGMGDHQGCPGR
jgi:hypothetical protein